MDAAQFHNTVFQLSQSYGVALAEQAQEHAAEQSSMAAKLKRAEEVNRSSAAALVFRNNLIALVLEVADGEENLVKWICEHPGRVPMEVVRAIIPTPRSWPTNVIGRDPQTPSTDPRGSVEPHK